MTADITSRLLLAYTAFASISMVISPAPATPVNSFCGGAVDGLSASAPTTNLCAEGDPSAVSGSGPWDWPSKGSNGGATAYCSAALLPPPPAASSSPIPYVAPTRDEVLNSPRKVFAHYVFSPLMYGPKDYWPNSVCMSYIAPSVTPASAGNQRLCPSPPITSGANPSTYIIDNLKTEISNMIARGINGIAVDLFSVCDWSQSGTNCPNNPGSGGKTGYPGNLINLLNAAAAVDSRFVILPMPDMTAGIKPTDLPNLWTAPIGSTTIYNHPNIYRWPDAHNYPELSPIAPNAFRRLHILPPSRP